MGAAMVPMGTRIQARSVAVFGSASSLRPELTGITLALDCPQDEDLNILTDSLSSMLLLNSFACSTGEWMPAPPQDLSKSSRTERSRSTLQQTLAHLLQLRWILLGRRTSILRRYIFTFVAHL